MGRLYFKQYPPLKSLQFRIKKFELCESHSDYLWSFAVYSGKESVLGSPTTSKKRRNATAILLQISEHHKVYTLWVDNYYNSAVMAKFLKSYNRDCAGTVKANRKVMPKKLQESKLQNGDAAEQQDGPESVLAMA